MKTWIALVVVLGALGRVNADEQHRGTYSNIVKSEARRHPIAPSDRGSVWAAGILFARPNRTTPQTGTWFKSDEIHLIIGQFADEAKFVGNPWNVSTRDPAMLAKIDALKSDKQYLFHYTSPYPLHFHMTETDVEVFDVEPAKTPDEFLASGLPTEFDIIGGRMGQALGPNIISGRVVNVLRWNTYFLGRPMCSFDLDLGGSQHSEGGDRPNQIRFNVYSEEACKYVHDIVPYGLEMRVTYTAAYITRDHYKYTAHSLAVDKIPGLSSGVPGLAAGIPTLAQEVLNDPDFQAAMRKLIDEFWSKKNPAPPGGGPKSVP